MFAAGAAMALVIALAAVAWFGLRLTLVQWLLDDTLARAAPPGTMAEVSELSAGHAVLRDIDIPGLGRIARAEARFTLSALLDGHVDVVTLDRPAFSLALDDTGAPTGPLREWLADSGEGSGAPLPLGRIVIAQGSLHVESPFTWANVALEGAYSLAARDAGNLSFTIDSRLGALEGSADLSGFAAGQDGRAEVTFGSAHLGVPGAEAADITGRAQLSLGPAFGAVLSLRAETTDLDGHPLGPLALSGTWAAGKASFDVDVGGADSAATARLTAAYDSTASPAAWSLSGLLAAALDLELPLADPLLLRAPTRIELDLAGAVPQAGDGSDLSGGGTIDVTSQGFGNSQITTGPIALPLRVAVDGPSLQLALTAPGRIDAIATAFDGRAYDLAFPEDGLELTLARDDEGAIGAEAAIVAHASAPDGFAAEASGQGALRLAPDGNLLSASLRQLDIALRGPLAPGMAEGDLTLAGGATLDEGAYRIDVDAEGDFARLNVAGLTGSDVALTLPLHLEGAVDGELHGSAVPVALVDAARLDFGEVHVEKLLAELPLRLDLDDDGLAVSLADTAWIDIGAVRHPAFTTTSATSLKVMADGLPLFTLKQPGKTADWDARVVLAGSAIALDVLDGDGAAAVSVTGTLPDIRISGGRMGSHLQASAETHNGDLKLAGPDIALSDLEFLLSYNSALSAWPQIQATGIDLRDLVSPARFVPARADIAFKPVWPLGRDARMSFDLHVGDQRYMANVEASWEPARKRLSAYVRVPPIRFTPALQPADLSPLYGPLLTNASGALEIVGALGLEGDDAFADLHIILDDLGGTLAGADVRDLAGRVHISDLDPLRTPPGQQITASALDPGLPMENLALTFSLPGNGAAWLSQASLELAGGSVSAEPTTFDPARTENRVVLDVAGVQLSRLAALLEMPEVEATGRLSGTIPVLLADGDIAIEKGRLETQEPGVLRYLPEGGTAIAGGDEYMELVVNALANFHYQSLAVDLDRALGGASVVGLHINGANPDVYDGYPIELNVNLSGDLDRIARDSMAGWRIPDEIRKRLSGF